MTILFHPHYDARCHLNPDVRRRVLLDTLVIGPLGLLQELELRLGLTTTGASALMRTVNYMTLLRNYFAGHPDSLFASSFEADEYALAYMESQSDDFPQSDLYEIVQYLKRDTAMVQALRKQFESTDPQLRGYITPTAAETALKNVCQLQRHEATTIIRRWTEKEGFDYFSFMSCLA